jgi:protein-disulfide isomerase
MAPPTKRVIAGILLTLLPLVSVNLAKQSAWGKFLATPKARQTGNPHARVTLVEYSDFQCPMCAHIQPTLHQFLERYEGKVRLAYKYFPLTRIHKNAMAAAHAAECAAGQNQFWPYQDRLFETQTQGASLSNPTSSYMALAQEVRLDIPKFSACLSDASQEIVIEQDHTEGQNRQINSTPTLFIGDERLVGSYIETDGARMIERALRK